METTHIGSLAPSFCMGKGHEHKGMAMALMYEGEVYADWVEMCGESPDGPKDLEFAMKSARDLMEYLGQQTITAIGAPGDTKVVIFQRDGRPLREQALAELEE